MAQATTGAPPTVRNPKLIIAILCFGSLCGALMQSLVIPIQSELPQLLGTSASNASWVVTATLLGAAVAMPVIGRLADMFGKQPMLVVTAAILTIASIIVALSDSLAPVLVGRVLQGIAMGFIPVAISLVRETVPANMRNSAVAGVSATLGVGGALGLPIAAWVAEKYDWHMLFWLSAVLAAITLAAVFFLIPNMHDAHPARLDIVGVVGLAVGLVSVLVAVSKGSTWGWTDPLTIGLIVGGLVVLLLWGWYEVRHHDPLVDLRTTARRPVLLTNIGAVLIGFGMMAQSIVVPQLLQMPKATGYGLGQSILHAGLWMAPAGIVMMLFTPISSTLLSRIGGRLTLSIGAFVLAGGYVLATFLTSAPWELMLATCITAAGVGIGYAAMPTLILDNVPAEEAGSSVGLNGLMRSMGTTIAGAVMAAVLSSQTMTLAPGTPAIPTHDAFRLCFIVGAVAAVIGALIVLLIPRQPKTKPVLHEQTTLVEEPAAV